MAGVACNDCSKICAPSDLFRYETMAMVQFDGFKLDDGFTYYQKVTRHRCIECTEGLNDVLFLRMIDNPNPITIRRVKRTIIPPRNTTPEDDAEAVAKMIDTLSDYQPSEPPAIIKKTTTSKRSNYSSSLSNNKK